MVGKREQGEVRVQADAWLRDEPALPLPGHGQTLQRWRALARMGAHDLCLAKVLEAHHDAVAILAGLHHPPAPEGGLMAVWAAHAPGSVLAFDARRGTVSGEKAWCSGADLVDAALVTVRDEAGDWLLKVDIDESVTMQQSAWAAPGMASVRSATARFNATPAVPVGTVDAYLQRPGFWHGGAGIAAVWFGAAAQLAESVRGSAGGELRERLLGCIGMALGPAAASLRELASAIDAEPGSTHQQAVVLARSVVERACVEVLDLAGRALGPAPMCLDGEHARRWADLTVFIRQSHADRDWATLGAAMKQGDAPWRL